MRCLLRQSEADRCYEEWSSTPAEDGLVALYNAILARAKRYASDAKLDYTTAYDLASELTLALRDGYRPKIKKTFGVWLDVRLRTYCINAVKARNVEAERLAPLETAAEISASGMCGPAVPLDSLRGVDRRIVALYLRGHSQAAIAKRLRMTQQAVSKRLKNLANLVVKQAV